jgi:hypothetical protein
MKAWRMNYSVFVIDKYGDVTLTSSLADCGESDLTDILAGWPAARPTDLSLEKSCVRDRPTANITSNYTVFTGTSIWLAYS